MSRHQIIYTSCKRGINGVNDGQQVFSYDAAFEQANLDEVRSLFSYQHPQLSSGLVMTEALADTMPRAFVFRRLPDGACALALNTYLGRDYMGEGGRFGNYMSHCVLCSPREMEGYPLEYYGSPMLRERMAAEEVNNPQPPAHLPTPVMEKGTLITPEAVTDFLGEGDRIEIYKDMLYAMLAFERARKRLVICDAQENVPLWIAALAYALPLQNALQVNFTTYDPDPSLSASRICGVVPEGTRYTPDSAQHHFVFDLLRSDTPTFDKDDEFFSFIDTAMTFSYDSLQDFHRFLETGYAYTAADEALYAAYTLYVLCADGIGGVNQDQFIKAIAFADAYGNGAQDIELARRLLQDPQALAALEDGYAHYALGFLMHRYERFSQAEQAALRTCLVGRVLHAFADENAREASFADAYARLDGIAQAHGVRIATELMRAEHQTCLRTAVQGEAPPWKLAFLVRMLSEYALDRQIPIDQLPNSDVGALYSDLIVSAYAGGAASGSLLVARILDAFAGDGASLTDMALNLEGFLRDVPNGEGEIAAMWTGYYSAMARLRAGDRDAAFAALYANERYAQMFGLFEGLLRQCANAQEASALFGMHVERAMPAFPAYARQYGTAVVDAYAKSLRQRRDAGTANAELALLDLVTREQRRRDLPAEDRQALAAVGEDLIADLIADIPLREPSKAHENLLRQLMEYTKGMPEGALNTGKLQLISMGMIIERMNGRRAIATALDALRRSPGRLPADLTRLSGQEIDAYLKWILPRIVNACENAEDLLRFYALYDWPRQGKEQFMATCTAFYLRQSKGGKDYQSLCEFLQFVFSTGDHDAYAAVGEALGKLNRQRMEALNDAVRHHFGRRPSDLRKWEEIWAAAKSFNPVLDGLTGLFKRKK